MNKQAYINGFLHKAAAAGYDHRTAMELLKSAVGVDMGAVAPTAVSFGNSKKPPVEKVPAGTAEAGKNEQSATQGGNNWPKPKEYNPKDPTDYR